ncbi:GntR family transcriptional regulator [Lacrimispora defluvii]|uniref:GntR family transcriptional regulator n=1 Tax=Lacrimispora defluvii TaxID=2719233 RepID=A0ABX1VRJ5_9FIRM|nr:GntR family transcriptional regulator [Lacrimispora defluvii]MBE5980462.1 GntR family transcriptional regulator [Paenibacillaceae bacterium]NNJ30933.1 GntR family transcriptional regulator [Lacrimispora defluvii]
MSSRKTEFIVIDLVSKIYQQKFWNNKLPTQRDLASAYQVSRFTIQKALKRLESIGLISVIQGDGIYVRARALGNPLVYNSMIEVPYQELQSKMLYLKKIIPDPKLVSIFNLNQNEEVWEYKRLRIVRYEITQIETGWIPCRLFPELSREIIEDSIQNHALKNKYQISHFMTNYQPNSLTKEEAELLGCKKGTPAMEITSRGVLKDGTIFVYSKICAIHYECTYIIPFNKEVYLSRRKKGKQK